ITPPTLTITSPNGGETYLMGQTITATWNKVSMSASDQVALYLYHSASTTYYPLGTYTNSGSQSVTLPAGVFGAGCYLYVGLTSGAVYDYYNSRFTIATPMITLTAPNGGESYLMGQTITATWNSTNLSSSALVTIYHYSNGAYYNLGDVQNTGSANVTLQAGVTGAC